MQPAIGYIYFSPLAFIFYLEFKKKKICISKTAKEVKNKEHLCMRYFLTFQRMTAVEQQVSKYTCYIFFYTFYRLYS